MFVKEAAQLHHSNGDRLPAEIPNNDYVAPRIDDMNISLFKLRSDLLQDHLSKLFSIANFIELLPLQSYTFITIFSHYFIYFRCNS